MNKLILPLLLLTGCATSTGVMKMGRDTYTITTSAAPARGGVSGARSSAYKEATEHCSAMNKEVLVKNDNGLVTNGYGAGSAQLTFRCLDADDPEMTQRPDYKKPADIVIENR